MRVDTAASRPLSLGGFIWGPRQDVAIFGGTAAFALLLVALGRTLGLGVALPEWAWIVFVLGVDVAHVYSTLFRTYLDGDELRRHPVRYVALPLLAYAASVTLYAFGAAVFWRALAYVALFHFVRQQIGWAALYRARSIEERTTMDAVIDGAAIYAATLYPVYVWHLSPASRPFSWFFENDFWTLPPGAHVLEPAARALWICALALFFLRQVTRAFTQGRFALGRVIIVGSTALLWYVGIVAGESDFDFTVTNVLGHGVPYVALLWGYARARQSLPAPSIAGAVAHAGFGAFAVLLLALAFFEEMAWDRLVWGDRPWLFGTGPGAVEAGISAWLVPLLAVPQTTHYLLDGLLWRRREARDNAAQRLTLGVRS